MCLSLGDVCTFSSTNEYGDLKCNFYIVDLLKSPPFHNEIESTLKHLNYTHWLIWVTITLVLSNLNLSLLKNESECGCCFVLHMYLLCISTSIENLEFHLNLLENIEDLSKKCQT